MIDMNRKIKTIDIAKKSGVSVTTVSRYFNHPELLSEKTIQKIEYAIRETDYSQDPLAKAMVTGNSDLVGVILPNLHETFFTEFLSQLELYSRKKHLHLLLHLSDSSAEEERAWIKQLCAYRVRGIFLLSQQLPNEIAARLPVPIVAIGRESSEIKRINSDYFSGGLQSGQLLLSNGCRAFAYFRGSQYTEYLPEYKQALGFEQAVKQYPYLHIEGCRWDDPYSTEVRQEAEQRLEQLVTTFSGKKIGILCADIMTANVLTAVCIRCGIHIPSQLEIIGCGNPVRLYDAPLPVTTMEQDIPLMAQLAMEALNDPLICERVVPVRMVRRETTS